jgi:dTDP-4-dehydrorhamnose reductase
MITGSSGMLGMDLCKCFSDGFDILGIDIRQPQERLFAAEDVDLTDRKLLQTTFDRFKPEIVFHAAAMTNVDGCEQNFPDECCCDTERGRLS